MTEGAVSGAQSGAASGMEEAVTASLATLDGEDRDQAAAELALTYAREVDLGGDVAKLGPALLGCLTALLLTPAARAAAMKGVPSASPATAALDQLAEARKRKSNPPNLDTAAT